MGAGFSWTTYHRLASPSQIVEDARRQEASGELWGKQARGSSFPKVKAYLGPLPNDRDGIEFTTSLPPDDGSPPGYAVWSGPRDGVIIEGGYAKIKAEVRLIRYR